MKRTEHPAGLPELLTNQEVAMVFRVGVAAVNDWVRAGRLAAVRTPTGRARYRRSDVEALLLADVTQQTTEGSWA